MARPPGSSPLARGLLTDVNNTVDKFRIIPARAGFTRTLCHTARYPTDHPRSRGVYRPLRSTCRWLSGSSPLARGLPASHPKGAVCRWIIPARAGFTPRQLLMMCSNGDHPRSRGVYPGRPCRPRSPSGSSPLARGLQDITGWEVNITEDHPRSRGVYAEEGSKSMGVRGSSPLARGLPGGKRAMAKLYRIIPARAGFTLFHPPAPRQ